jgi:SpoU rRNA methylase family enzyme
MGSPSFRAPASCAQILKEQIGKAIHLPWTYKHRGGQMKKLVVFVAVFAMSSAFAANDKADTKNAKLETVTGVVSDAKCGAANHDADCVKKCEEAGEPLVIVNDKDKSVMSVKNPEVLKGHEGHHVRLKAHVYPDNSLHIMNVAMMKKQPKATGGGEMHQ